MLVLKSTLFSAINTLRPLIAAEATSFGIALKEAKRHSCCDHLSSHKARAGLGATAGHYAFWASLSCVILQNFILTPALE
jgi:hypothetical protein